MIKEAIERELGRGGQVFVVHNRIQSLPALVRFIERLVPRARIAMAHGQMRETVLERTMLDYVDGAYDVLVATAIIESGLDIPASNTIIINRADRLGLAQLYQLRGRVGRDRLQAYAYLLIPADGRVDETAAKRLRVIQELTALGSGLKVALRDMEIRGAGNLLGAQQHGQIEMVGFDLYLKLLEEAVRELRGEPVEDEVDPVVTVDVAAYLPEDYVAEPAQRLALYKRLAGVADRRPRSRRSGGSCGTGSVRSPRRPRGSSTSWRSGSTPRPSVSSGSRCAAGHALLTFAPSTPVPPQRIVDLLRVHGRRLRTGAGVRARGHGRPRALAGDLPDPHPAPRRVPRTDGGTPMNRARLALAGLVVAGALGACRAPAGPLPPVPAGSGGVLVRAGEAPPDPGRARP